MIRIPKPSYLRSQLTRREKPDIALYQVLTHLAEVYQLGQIQACYRAPHSLSLNFFVTTSLGKFVFRKHRLSEADVAYEHQVLDHLQQRSFPAPRILTNQAGQAWTAIDGTFYSVYEFLEGYCPTNYLWWPSTRREITVQCGRTLAEYHQAVANLIPTNYKWNGYRPTLHKRWREGDWFRQVLKDIDLWLQKSVANSPLDDFVGSRINELNKMLRLESVVEKQIDLSKLVIHGDYASWNVLFRSDQTPVVLDFNEARLDLKIYDIVFATFRFAWSDDHLNQDRLLAFQAGYTQVGQLHKLDVKLAGSVFQWVMARSITERLFKHYLEQHSIFNGVAGLERQFQMCSFAEQQPRQLVAGLNGITE